MKLRQTPGQTLGPFFHQGLLSERPPFFPACLAPAGIAGLRIALVGCVFDGLNAPVGDALLEVWQADAQGQYPDSKLEHTPSEGFVGFGRAATNAAGQYAFQTLLPGPVPGVGAALQAPHLNLIVGARGLTRHLFTRAYFEDDPLTSDDPVLRSVPAERRRTLLAKPESTGEAARGLRTYRFDIRLRGEEETVFFDV